MKEFKGTNPLAPTREEIERQREIDEFRQDLLLFKAAPDLLKALQDLMEGVRNLPPLTAIAGTLEKQYKQAEQAINKALGL